jgi:acetyl-CoA carboxylase alpha subunit
MGVEDPEERIQRTKQLGKIPNVKKTKGKLKQRLTEKEIEEEKKNKMVKMVEDIITNKLGGSDGEVIEKVDSLSKILIKNLESIKKLAKKEGISLNKLINVLKKSE